MKLAGAIGAQVPSYGILFLVVMGVVNLHGAKRALDRRAVFAAVALAALVTSLAHNLSTPTLRLVYDNNPIVPWAILSLLLAAEQARAPWLKYALFGLMMFGLFGAKFRRYADARTPSNDDGFWRGMQVSANGVELLRAAARARELAGPTGTVLMLPEDPMFEALVGRPRPKLRGAVLFVDQYPSRLLEADLAQLKANPPDVLILHPREPADWLRVFALWSVRSATARVMAEFQGPRLEAEYRRDSSYKTWMFKGPGVLDLYQRKAPAGLPSSGEVP